MRRPNNWHPQVAIGNQGTINGDWVIAGGDVYQVHRETKIGTGAVLLIALVAASVVLAAGRIETGAERPPPTAPGSRTGPTPPEVSSPGCCSPWPRYG
jgi:hypothetical protein